MKITEQEIKEMQDIVDQYREIYDRFEKVQNIIEQASKEKDNLLIELDKTHNEEEKFYRILHEKYGKGKLNFDTLKYETDEDS